eukprot:890564-Amphidinium_carterae.1
MEWLLGFFGPNGCKYIMKQLCNSNPCNVSALLEVPHSEVGSNDGPPPVGCGRTDSLGYLLPSMGDGGDSKDTKDDEQTVAREHDLIGEWCYVENVLTITQEGAILKLVTDSSQQPLFLKADGKEFAAKKDGSDKILYTVSMDSQNTATMRKGTQTYQIHRVGKTTSLLGDWTHSSKRLAIEESTPGTLSMISGGRALRLLRVQVKKWEASKEETGDAVYHIEHTEGADSIAVLRLGSGRSIEFHRDAAQAGEVKDKSDVLEFVKTNNLSQRVED